MSDVALSPELTDKEKVNILEELIKALGDLRIIIKFRGVLQELAIRAIGSDEGFHRFSEVLSAFVKEHGDEFPALKEFLREWNGYGARWKELIFTSRDFSAKTAAAYEDYTVLLKLFEDAKTKEDLQDLAAELKEFSKRDPVHVEFKDKIIDLKRDVNDFRAKLFKYIDDLGPDKFPELERLIREIDALVVEIENLDKQIGRATIGLGLAPWWTLFAAVIPGTILATLVVRRATKQKELDFKINELGHLEKVLKQLIQLKAELAGLTPIFNLLADDLGFFPDTWAGFHKEAAEFAKVFESVGTPDSVPEKVKLQIKLALAVSNPLVEGLKNYARSVQL